MADQPRQCVAFTVQPEHLDNWWSGIEGMLRATPWSSIVPVETVRTGLLSRHLQLWIALDPEAPDAAGKVAFAITQIKNLPDLKLFSVWLVALREADQGTIDVLLEATESFGRERGGAVMHIVVLPRIADRVRGKETSRGTYAVTIERDLRARRSIQ